MCDLGLKSSARNVGNLACSELRGPAVFTLFNPWKFTGVVYPEMYFLAAGELLTFMIAVSIVITLLAQTPAAECFDPTTMKPIPGCDILTIDQNPIRARIGHNNPCVFFDMPPAKYFAAYVYVFAAYCGIRYTLLDMERSILVKDRLSWCKFIFSIVTDLFYMLAWVGFVFTYVIPPYQNIWLHSLGFMWLGTAQFFIFFANCLEGENFPWCVYIFCALYGFVTILEFGGVAAANFWYYDITGGVKGPLIPSNIGFVIDYGWFLMLALTSAIFPKAEPLLITTTIASVGDDSENGSTIGKESSDDEESGGLFGCCPDKDQTDEDEEPLV